MDRRRVLGLGGAGLLAALSPEWLARAFVQEPPKLDDLQRGIDRAGQIGKPLIVFVVPVDGIEREQRGRAFGYMLSNSDDEFRADLVLAEIVCARASDVARHFPNIAGPEQPKFFAIEGDVDATKITAPKVELADEPLISGLNETEIASRIAEWLAPLRTALRKSIVGDAASATDRTLEIRARAARRVLDHETLDSAELAITNREPVGWACTDRAAALFRVEAARSTQAKELWIPQLAFAFRGRLLQQAMPGARWALDIGCGYEVQEQRTRPAGELDEYVAAKSVGGMCGMGNTPEASRRFLYFLTRKA